MEACYESKAKKTKRCSSYSSPQQLWRGPRYRLPSAGKPLSGTQINPRACHYHYNHHFIIITCDKIPGQRKENGVVSVQLMPLRYQPNIVSGAQF